MVQPKWTHLDESGAAQMVDVGDKAITRRTAVAVAGCTMQPETASAIRNQKGPKGDVLQVARIAAIQSAKKTSELIPLCHMIPLERVAVEFRWLDECRLDIEVSAVATAKTGVEMEALVGASVAALTIYDMCKALDRALTIQNIALVSKSGGSSGDYQRSVENA